MNIIDLCYIISDWLRTESLILFIGGSICKTSCHWLTENSFMIGGEDVEEEISFVNINSFHL